MKYKPGDEVLVKGAITDLHEGTDHPYFVAVNYDSVHWVSEDKIIPMDKTYADGLSDAWELAKSMVVLPEYGGISNGDLVNMFGTFFPDRIFKGFTVQEVLAKIEAYEKETVCVGDVVEDEEGTKALVIDEATENTCFVFTENGCVEEWYKKYLKKTGKKISIESLLKEIGE